MIAETIVVDVGVLERQPTPPPLADKIKSLLERGASRAILERVAGGRANLRYIMRSYLARPLRPQPLNFPDDLPPRPIADPEVALNPPPIRRARDRARWQRRGEVLRLQLEAEWRLDCIGEIVAAGWNVTEADLTGRAQSKKLVNARVAFCLLARAHAPSLALAEITRYIGRDHATFHYYDTNRERFTSCPDFARRYAAAESEIAAAFVGG